MDQQVVREHAQAHCDALLAGEVDRAIEDFSPELRSNVGEVISQLPLPLTSATVESVEPGGKAFVAVLLLAGESEQVRLQTRWKERDGRPTIVEVSQAAAEAPPPAAPEEPAE
jgi:hypothetical protein